MNRLGLRVVGTRWETLCVGLAVFALDAGQARAEGVPDSKPGQPVAPQAATKPTVQPAPTQAQPAQAIPVPVQPITPGDVPGRQQICQSSGGTWAGNTCDYSASANKRDSCEKAGATWYEVEKTCDCPSGKTWKTLRGATACTKSCGADEDFDTNRGCVKRPKAPDCEKDTLWDGTQCRANCSPGSHLEHGKGCVADPVVVAPVQLPQPPVLPGSPPISMVAWGHAAFWPGVMIAGLFGGVAMSMASNTANDYKTSANQNSLNANHAWSSIAVSSFAIGGALMATGVGLWIFAPHPKEQNKTGLRLSPGTSETACGLSMTGGW